MNEVLFLIQIFVIVACALAAYKLGKEALVAWVAIQALLANLFVLKQITLFGLNVTASDAFAIGSLLGLNFLQEYSGREAANKAIWICFFFMIFFVVASQIHLFFQPSVYDTTQNAYTILLSPTPRLFIASLCVFFVVQQFDIRLFSLLKNKLPQAAFAWRAGLSLVASQLLDTCLFSFAGLYGIVASVVDIIVISFIVKLAVILCFSSIVKWVKT